MLKKCSRCKHEKVFEAFYENTRMKDGRNTYCIDCHKADNTARKRRNRATPAFRAQEQAFKKAYRGRTQAQRKTYQQAWRAENKAHLAEYGRVYRDAHTVRCRAHVQKRHAAVLKRSPVWLDVDALWMIEQAYELAELRTRMFGFSWHVDHKLPLRGRTVSGLHVPENLQVIPGVDNMRKSNLYEAT